MNVLFVPDYREGNPYQRELADALGRCGLNVSLSNGGGPLPLVRAIKTSGRPELLHLHWTHTFILPGPGSRWKNLAKPIRFVLELLFLKMTGTKMVWTVHNLVNHEQRNRRIELLFNGICARLYDQMIVHCRFAKESVVQAYSLPPKFNDKITVIPHPAYIATYENWMNRKQARNYFGFEEQKTVFLFLGQIRPYRGLFHLACVFQQLDDPRARLLVAGKPMNEVIGKKLEDHLRRDERIRARLEFIPDDEIQMFMNAADVVVLPYHSVLTSGSLLLAMSFGRAVIAPRLGCIPEALDDRGGFLYNPRAEDGLLHAMRQALNADLGAMGRHNSGRARQFDWDEAARKTYAVYQRCFA